MKVNTPSPSLTRLIAKRLAVKIATKRREKAKPIRKIIAARKTVVKNHLDEV